MISRKNILNKFKWLNDSNRHFIISANYDGLICAAFLSHYLNWKLVGYYNMEKIWISDTGVQNKKDLIWVDLDILPRIGKTLGGHIVKLEDSIPSGFDSSCNPNILLNLSNKDFTKKYPLSTLAFLMWLFNIQIPSKNFAKFLILHSDAIWLKYQRYTKNFNDWLALLDDYKWEKLFNNIDSLNYDKKVDQIFYPQLINAGAISGFSKLHSKYLNIKSRESKFNPDWDEDSIMNIFELVSNHLSWNKPTLPAIIKRIDGVKNKCSLSQVKEIGLDKMISKKHIFSYAITSPRYFSYTTFGDNQKRVLDAKT